MRILLFLLLNCTPLLAANPKIAGGLSVVLETNGTHYVTSTGGSVNRSTADRFAEVKNALDYGASTNAANNATAIQAAIDAASGYPVRVVIPAGYYRIASKLTLSSNVTLEGEAPATAYLNYTNRGTVLVFDDTLTAAIEATNNYITIQNLTISGNNKAITGIYFSGTAKIQNVQMHGFEGAALWGINYVNSSLISGCTVGQSDIGLRLSGNQPTILRVYDSTFEENRIGIEISGGTPDIEGCVIESNTEFGIYMHFPSTNVANPGPIYIQRAWIEDNRTQIYSASNAGAKVRDLSLHDVYMYPKASGVTTNFNLADNFGLRMQNVITDGSYGTVGSITNVFASSVTDGIYRDTISLTSTNGFPASTNNPTYPASVDNLIEGVAGGVKTFVRDAIPSGTEPILRLNARHLSETAGGLIEIGSVDFGGYPYVGFGGQLNYLNGVPKGDFVVKTSDNQSVTEFSEAFRVTGQGRIGISTNDPKARFHLRGDGTTNNLVHIGEANGAYRVVVDSNGKLGVGTPTPGGWLHINTTNWNNDHIVFESSGDNSRTFSLRVVDGGGSGAFFGVRDRLAGANRLIIDNDGHTRPGADSTYNLGASGTEWLRAFIDTVTAGIITVNPSAFGVGWDGSTNVPTMDDVYDAMVNRQPLDSDLTTIANNNPGNSYYYGTDPGGTKGFYTFPGAATHTNTVTIACSDMTTALTAGATKAYWRAPFNCTVVDVRASVITASSSGVVTVDINDGGTTILSTKLTIDASEKTSTTAATPYVLSDTALSNDAEVTIDIDAEGTNAAGLLVTIYYVRVS